jgi:predicted metal-binding membrane protein
MAEAARQLPPVEALVRRDRLIVAGGLAVLILLAWLWLLSGAGTGMDIRMTSRPALFPGGGDAMDMMAMGASPWSAATWLLMIGMWWIMMIAMMIPSAAPMILLHARVVRHARKGREDAAPVPSGAFLAGYLAVWLGFSVTAAALQFLAGQAGLLSQPMMWAVNVWLAAGLLVAAGLYQLSAL